MIFTVILSFFGQKQTCEIQLARVLNLSVGLNGMAFLYFNSFINPLNETNYCIKTLKRF